MLALPASPAFLVAFSGGADSRCLLEETLLSVPPGVRVAAAHLHHGIRGAEADRDEAFCRSVCADRHTELFVGHADVPSLAARSGKSLELAAREARYDFLTNLLREQQIPVLLTAHHADDVLETVLWHLLRGSGIRGLSGIPEKRELGCVLPDGTPCFVFRPFLNRTRREILEEVTRNGWSYVTDSTNLANDCTRNRLRHEIVPALESVTGTDQPQKSVARLARAAREDEETLMALSKAVFRAARDGGEGSVAVSDLRDQPPSVAKRVIGMAYADAIGHATTGVPPDRTLSAFHLEELLSLCRNGQEGEVSSCLPGHMRGEIRAGKLLFSPSVRIPGDSPPTEGMPASPGSPDTAVRRLGEGLTLWKDKTGGLPPVFTEIERLPDPLPPKTGGTVFASAVFPEADGSVPLFLPLPARNRAEGDVILSRGLHKKLRRVLIDTPIPAALRDHLPLFCLDDGQTPLWYPGSAFRDGFLPPETGPCLRITVYLGAPTDQSPVPADPD